MNSYYKNKRILVTGGVGTIGSCLVTRLLASNPQVIRVLDTNEQKLFELSEQKNNKIRPLLGDIRDYPRLKKAMEGVDIVFHAAALKHVELSEFNPFEVVKTNVLGTQNLLEAALSNNIERVVVISTDKAVNPVSTMGATKLLAEKLTVSASYHKGNAQTKFAVVRFGNVLGSNGSVIPLWLNQIKINIPITLTDKKMTRFIMSQEEAIDLVLKAASKAKGGEIFILKMPSVRIEDLAKAVISLFKKKSKSKNITITIKEIGSKVGEKLHEKLVIEEELKNLYETKDMFIIKPKSELMGLSMIKLETGLKKSIGHLEYSSNSGNFLNQSEIISLLEKAHIL